MLKKIISIVLVIVWMTFIFVNSNEVGLTSGSKTDNIISTVVSTVSDIEENSEEMSHIISNFKLPLRKAAHFFEYAVLAFLVINMFVTFNVTKKALLLTILVCVVYAVTDEIHQLFVPDRSGRVTDVLLDSSAVLITSYLYNKFIIMRYFYAKKIN